METNVAWIEVFPSASGQQWYWRAKAGNGEIVATSEGYTRGEDARRAVAATFPGVEVREID